METSNLNKKIYFSGDTAEIISNILKKYSLEETEENLAKKIFEEDEEKYLIIRGGVILKIAISLVKKETTEKEAILLLQKDLNISQTIAEELVKEIKINLIPLATPKKPIFSKSSESSIEDQPEESKLIQPIKQPIEIDKILSPTQNQKTQNQRQNIFSPEVLQITKENVKRTTEKADLEQTAPTQQKRKNDVYREPIE